MRQEPGLGGEGAPADILVVEDEPLVRMLIADLLGSIGLPVREAPDAEQALADLAAQPARPRLLVTDINLGAGMNGVAFSSLMQQRWPGLPVVYVTANPDMLQHRALQRHERLVPKPFEIDCLMHAVRSLVAAA